MKIKDVIETIRIAAAEVEWNYPLDYAIAFESAIAALEKQVPKDPVNNYEYKWFECPACGLIVGTYYSIEEKHHCRCGQALDWSDDNE